MVVYLLGDCVALLSEERSFHKLESKSGLKVPFDVTWADGDIDIVVHRANS